ncbi:Discoidin domain-containing receptor tyrosine kinase B [Trichostrongylus colubriformis]|uniref:receptor protein-tyrosine kinase n=1 Tax=Trichostrongylus colubriformis TaxID=6319 RepID=A0AAN8EVT6_TRICO
MLLRFICFLAHIGYGLATVQRSCGGPLGLTNGRIRDDQLSASSSFDADSTGPQHARARTHTGSGAWCPLHQVNSTHKEWIQITFARDTVVTAVEVQGRFDEGRGMEFARAFKIEYWRPRLSGWASYRSEEGLETIPGNSDTRTSEIRVLDAGIVVRRLRVVPLSNSTRTVCLRLELYGCPYEGSLQSYSAPVGSAADEGLYVDVTYDGHISNGIAEGGLGQLSDGITGNDPVISPHRWVGWKKPVDGAGYVSLLFMFSEARNFSALDLHLGQSSQVGAEVFSKAVMSFSTNGADFSSRLIEFIPQSLNSPSWIRIPIPNRIATVIQIRLYFPTASSWLLLSEAHFESIPARLELIHFDSDEENSGSITYFSVDESNEERLGTMILLCLLTLTVVFPLIVVCFYRKRDKIRTASPPHGYNRSVFKPISTSTYQMARDNMENALLEKCPMIVISSDYAEPVFSSAVDKSSLEPLLNSFHNHAMDASQYAETKDGGSSPRNPLSSVAKYSDYGEVYCTTLPEINRNQLIYIEKIGQGEFGEVHRCLLESRQVAVKRLHSTSQDDEVAFLREIRVLGNLKHPNVVEVIGVSTIDKPMICIMEYMVNGDLRSYMSKMEHVDSHYCISVATQLAAGLAYLESCNFVHRDIAARNCLVDEEGNVKIADFGMARSLYSNDYYRVEGQFVLPIRWMAWESLLLGKFSTHSDVWAFGVTLWEVFSRCREKPYGTLMDDQVLENIQHMSTTSTLKHQLERPTLCPERLYANLIVPCWLYDPQARPSFEALHLQLQMLIHTRMT